MRSIFLNAFRRLAAEGTEGALPCLQEESKWQEWFCKKQVFFF